VSITLVSKTAATDFTALEFRVYGIYRGGVALWGCFAGEARKTPPQPPSVMVTPNEPELSLRS